MHWTSVWAFRLGVKSSTFSLSSSWSIPCVFLCVVPFFFFFLWGWGGGDEDSGGDGDGDGGGEGGPPASSDKRRVIHHTVGGGSKNIKTLVCPSY